MGPGLAMAQADEPLTVPTVMLRYDGQAEQGTFAPLVCNTTDEAIDGFEVSINGQMVPPLAEPLPAMNCAAIYDADSDFATFDVSDIGEHDVSVIIEIDGAAVVQLETTVTITQMGPEGPLADRASYTNCLTGAEHAECVGFMQGTPLADPHEIRYVDGTFSATGPAEFEALIPWYAREMHNCATQVADYLALDLPELITYRLVVTEAYTGSFAGINEITTQGDDSMFELFLDSIGEEWWAILIGGICQNPHETTHIFVAGTPIPGWFNEGLATFMEDPARIETDVEVTTECLEDQFVSYFYGPREEIDYKSLMAADYDFELPPIYYYWTASCFWVHLETTYGQEAVQQVVNDLVTYRDPDSTMGCPLDAADYDDPYFMRDIVVPIVGEEILDFTQEKFNVNAMYTGCIWDS